MSHVGFHCWSSAYTLLLRTGNNHRANNDRDDQRPPSASNAIVDRDEEDEPKTHEMYPGLMNR
jgi:hypothetical protein